MVKWAKDLWRIREVMKILRDTENNLLNLNEETANGLIRNHFVWNEEGRNVDKEQERVEGKEVEEGAL